MAVTGASRGIGRATALEFARHGYRVCALARSVEDLQTLAGESEAIVPVVMDIASDASRSAAVDRIMEETDGYGVDVLVNNAGYGQTGPLEELPIEKFRRQLEVNVIGLLAFTQPFLPGMRERRAGSIVNISSAAGRIATPFQGAYNASKFALEAMSDALRNELSPWHIHVILIEPGPIPTHFGEVAGQEVVGTEPSSPYARYVRRYQRTHGGVGLFSRSPQAVAELIFRAVSLPHPKARYTITLPARLAELGRWAPDRLVDWAYRVGMGLR